MVGDWFFIQKESSCVSHVPCSHYSSDDFLTICIHQCLILGRAKKYNHVTIALQPIMPIIPLEDTVVVIRQQHPLPSNHVPPLSFYFQPNHTFVLNRTLFAQALAIAPHLFLGGPSGMDYEHLSSCFILEDASSRFFKLFQTAVTIFHGDILKLVALMLRASKLLAMVKDTKSFHLIVVGGAFFQFISRSIIL
jgi:hypothetical protein